MARKSWTASLVGDGAATFGGQILVAVGLLVGTRALTEVVPPSVFGAVSLVVGVSTFGFNLLCSPVVQAALRFYPEASAHGRLPTMAYALRSSLRRTTSLSVLLILGLGAIYCRFARSSYEEFIAMSLLVVLEGAKSFDQAFLNASGKQPTYAAWSAAEAWLRPLGALLVVALFGPKVMSVLVGYVMGSALIYAVLHRRAVPPTAAPDPAAMAGLTSSIMAYAMPLMPIAIVNWISSLSDRYIIGGARGLDEAGIYAAGYALASRPLLMVMMTLAIVLRPKYYEAVSRRDAKEAATIIRLWVRVCFGLGLAATAAVFVLRHVVVALTVSARYRAAADLLPPITLGYAICATAGVHSTVCLALRRPAYATYIEVSGAIAAVVFEIPMIRWKGALGAAWAVPMYYGVQYLTARHLARKLSKEAEAAQRSGSSPIMGRADAAGDSRPG
jgi:O-antigen/teichoic acid export membrane protein